ncbi:MAG: putative alpha/beta superfamily hydrolase [Polaribacter sp.]|jgi:predicted alpha/beta superfamily hydrolase
MKKSFLPIIKVIEEAYVIPQLGRERRIAALLPHNYYETDKNYPVLYLHDGQNLFDDNAPYGNWGVDHSLAWMSEMGLPEVIIIAIDHGNVDRLREYAPFSNHRVGEAEGALYLRFLLETLRPYVNKNFRVLTDGANTGIGGSSMGGLISLYAGLHRPEIFSKWMIFSPSLWIAPRIFEKSKLFTDVYFPTSLYLYAGGKESKEHLPNVLRLAKHLKRDDLKEQRFRMQVAVNREGTHSEHYWGQEFPRAVYWLFGQ